MCNNDSRELLPVFSSVFLFLFLSPKSKRRRKRDYNPRPGCLPHTLLWIHHQILRWQVERDLRPPRRSRINAPRSIFFNARPGLVYHIHLRILSEREIICDQKGVWNGQCIWTFLTIKSTIWIVCTLMLVVSLQTFGQNIHRMKWSSNEKSNEHLMHRRWWNFQLRLLTNFGYFYRFFCHDSFNSP